MIQRDYFWLSRALLVTYIDDSILLISHIAPVSQWEGYGNSITRIFVK